MDRILIILKKENGPRASGIKYHNIQTCLLVYAADSGERLQDHWSSGLSFNYTNSLDHTVQKKLCIYFWIIIISSTQDMKSILFLANYDFISFSKWLNHNDFDRVIPSTK